VRDSSARWRKSRSPWREVPPSSPRPANDSTGEALNARKLCSAPSTSLRICFFVIVQINGTDVNDVRLCPCFGAGFLINPSGFPGLPREAMAARRFPSTLPGHLIADIARSAGVERRMWFLHRLGNDGKILHLIEPAIIGQLYLSSKHRSKCRLLRRNVDRLSSRRHLKGRRARRGPRPKPHSSRPRVRMSASAIWPASRNRVFEWECEQRHAKANPLRALRGGGK